MPRVNRTFVFVLLLASSCAFLLFQLYYYRNYVSKVRGGTPRSGMMCCQNLKKFLALAQFFRLPLFLADSAALALLSQDALRQRDRAMREPHCSFLCAGRPITSFALPASQWQLSVSAPPSGSGFLLENTPGHPVLGCCSTCPSLQVVLLYERSGGYLWHGALRLKATADPSFAPFRLLDYGRHAGAYDRSAPELLLTVVDGLDVRVPRNISRFLVQRQEARFLECRYHDARSFLQLYPDDSSAAAVEFRRKAKVLLRLAAQTLGRLDIPFWISSGTCLGWYRQCGVISYSRDVDIGIFISDFRPQITTAFRDAGMSLKHQFGKVEDSLELSFLGEDVKLDIFFFYRDGDVVWNGGTQAKSGRKFKYVFPSFSLCWAELLEVKVRVPCETLDYVMANYGGTWSVPVKSWDWKSSPSNVIENGVWPVAEWAGLIQVY
uniref:Fukutin n=1 Tax=Poecilia latipinna TaxID=48699 RepID=A0A3B3U783_9TELE